MEATLAVIARRSAAGSRLVVLYHRPAPILRIVGFVVRRIGEPLRSSFTPEAMRALLERHGLAVTRDQALPELGAAMSEDVARTTKSIRHPRLVTADRR